MARSQATLSAGQYWEMVKALGDRLPKGGGAHYHSDPGWYNQRVAELVGLERNSDAARQIEQILTRDPLSAQTLANPYFEEKTGPALFYPKGYQPLSVEEQVQAIVSYLGGTLGFVDSPEKHYQPDEPCMRQADGLYVVPKPSLLALHLEIKDPWDNFGELIERGPIAALKSRGRFKSWVAGTLTPERYRLAGSTRVDLQQMDADQMGDFIVFPAQTGQLYAGYSSRNSRFQIERAENPGQWSMTAYCQGWMLYANPHRLAADDHLCIDCPGDEYRFEGVPGFGRRLYFGFSFDELRFGFGWADDVDYDFGSASGFLR